MASGIAGVAGPGRSERVYDVYLAPDTPPDARRAVGEAMGAWTSAVPSLHFALVDACAERAGRAVICVAPATAEWLAGFVGDDDAVGVTWGSGGIINVRLDVDTLARAADAEPGDLEMVSAHELGHALGLGHDGHPGTLMYPAMRHCAQTGVGIRCVRVQATRPTPRDIAAWYAERGFSAP